MPAQIDLDALDERIIGALQQNGRLSYEELGNAIGLSASAALRRVKRLEEVGVIAGYVALIRARKIGLGLTAFINVRMQKQNGHEKRTPMNDFTSAVEAWPEVVECVALSGDMDYMLRVIVTDMDHFTRFVMDTLLKHESVQDCRSSFVLRPYKRSLTLV